MISIHALREEGDLDSDIAQIIYKISIHALREEGDRVRVAGEFPRQEFLSTPSARRATPMSRSICARRSKFLSTPSARRATLYNHRHAHCCQISIHALREEGDS